MINYVNRFFTALSIQVTVVSAAYDGFQYNTYKINRFLTGKSVFYKLIAHYA